MILEADYFGNRVQVLKFTEIVHEGETQRVKSPKILKRHEMSPQHAGHLAEASPRADKNNRSGDSEDDADGIGEGSVATVNEDLKTLKEIRILFSNKKSSRAMRVLMIVFGMFFLLLIGLACNNFYTSFQSSNKSEIAFQLSMTNRQMNEFSDLINYTMTAYNRYRSLGDVITGVRQYQYLTYTSKILPSSYISYYTNTSSTKV